MVEMDDSQEMDKERMGSLRAGRDHSSKFPRKRIKSNLILLGEGCSSREFWVLFFFFLN